MGQQEKMDYATIDALLQAHTKNLFPIECGGNAFTVVLHDRNIRYDLISIPYSGEYILASYDMAKRLPISAVFCKVDSEGNLVNGESNKPYELFKKYLETQIKELDSQRRQEQMQLLAEMGTYRG